MNFELGNIARSVALASALLASGSALAATQGSLSDTESEGTVDVTLEIADRVQITGLNDIDFGTWGGTGALSQGDDFCVYRNGSGLYDIALSSLNGAGGNFQVNDGTDDVVYTVKFDPSADASAGTDVANNGSVTGVLGDGTSTNCGGGSNAAIELGFTEATLQAMASGTWTDVITLTVTPN